MPVNHAQFGIASILRPFAGFETVYTGQSAATPIMFSQGGEARDNFAGRPGYSPDLLKGLKVPMGARALLWLPAVNAFASATFIPYAWNVSWRMRNVFDFREQRINYHYPNENAGVPDTTTPADPARVVIPAANQVIIYNQTEPATVVSGVNQNIRIEGVQPHRNTVVLPLLPDGSPGQYQQGLYLSGTPTVAYAPEYQLYEILCAGDEMLIGVTRAVDTAANWDFSFPDGADAVFAFQFGSASGGTFNDLGVYVMVGSAA